MKNINWKIRFKNPTFVIGLVSTIILLVQQIAKMFGYEISEVVAEDIIGIFNTFLGILIALGVMVDPTTEGTKDSEQALTYEKLGK